MGLKNFLRNNHLGFSITEVMVGGAILAGVALGGAKLFNEQKTAQKSIDENQKLDAFHTTLSQTLSNASNCNATFKFAYGRAITGNSTTSQKILRCVGPKCVDHKSDAGDIVADANPLFQKEMWVDKSQTWKIGGIYFLDSLNRSGNMRVKVDYEPYPLKGRGKISKTISLYLRFNESSSGVAGFKQCIDQAQASLNNMQNDLCRSLNAKRTNSANTIAYWDPDSQTCVLNSNIRNCSGHGEQIEGLRMDGSVHCRPINNGLNFPADSAKSCTQTVMEFNQATKKMVIRCL